MARAEEAGEASEHSLQDMGRTRQATPDMNAVAAGAAGASEQDEAGAAVNERRDRWLAGAAASIAVADDAGEEGYFPPPSSQDTIERGTKQPPPVSVSFSPATLAVPAPLLSSSLSVATPSTLTSSVDPMSLTGTTPATTLGGAGSWTSSARPILLSQASTSGLTTSSSLAKNTTASGLKRRRRRKQKKEQFVGDKTRLSALGYREELHRDYDFWASWGIGVCNIGFLQGTFFGVLTAFSTGGPSMFSIAWPISGVFISCLAAILAEMASTYPVAGAMFTWVFRLLRTRGRGGERGASWMAGSITLCAHLLTQVLLAVQLSNTVLGVVELYTRVDVTFWKTMGVAWALLVVCGLICSSPLTRSPLLWRLAGFLTVATWAILIGCLLGLTDDVKGAKEVFGSYENETGWESKGIVYLLGWSLTTIAGGFEACAHLAEDTKAPARTVPLAMFWCTVTSYALGWVSTCVLLATTWSARAALVAQAGEGAGGHHGGGGGAIALLAHTVPRGLATFLVCLLLILMLCQNVAQMLSTSRFIWALAREKALPFSNFFRYLTKAHRLPLPAIWAVAAITAPSLLLIGIDQSFISNLALQGTAFTTQLSYLVPIFIYLLCPADALTGDGRKEWTLRGMGRPLAVLVVMFDTMLLIVTSFPTGYPIRTTNISYAPVIALAVLILSSLTWVFYGNGRYAGPLKATTKWTLGAEVELPRSTSSKGGTTGSDGTPNGDTTSAGLGKSARVWAVSTAPMTHGGSTRGHLDSSAITGETGTTEMTTTTGRTETTMTDDSGDYTGSDEDGSETESEEEEEEITRSRRAASRPPTPSVLEASASPPAQPPDRGRAS